MLSIEIISVQPQMFRGFLEHSIVARAVGKGACEVKITDLRDFAHDRHRKVDDKPYGGGPGMLMACPPWFEAVEAALAADPPDAAPPARVVMTDPSGRRFDQRLAEEFSRERRIVFMCGHYEGFDERIRTLATDFVSIGDFVMTGGEIAAAAMADATVRLLPGVLGGGAAAVSGESFAHGGIVEAPQYTHPPSFRGMDVPEVLLSGDHARIEAWRRSEARRVTAERRPELLAGRAEP
jgi:tRNA (guanine37-N1)-methyltransferase